MTRDLQIIIQTWNYSDLELHMLIISSCEYKKP